MYHLGGSFWRDLFQLLKPRGCLNQLLLQCCFFSGDTVSVCRGGICFGARFREFTLRPLITFRETAARRSFDARFRCGCHTNSARNGRCENQATPCHALAPTRWSSDAPVICGGFFIPIRSSSVGATSASLPFLSEKPPTWALTTI